MLEPRHAAAISARFGLGADPVLSGPPARGDLGQVWRLTTARGDWAVKELFGPADQAEVDEQAAFQEAAFAAGVPTPAIVRSVDGAVLVDVDSTQVRVFGWADIEEPDPGLDPAQVGAVVAAIHRVDFDGDEPVHPWYTDPVGTDRWDELVTVLAVRGAPFAAALADLRDEIVAMEAMLVAPREVRTCHRDLWADNLRGTPAGGVCVIDWENSGHADPAHELAMVLYEFAGDDPRRGRPLYLAYLDAGGPARLTGAGDFSMVIAQVGHINEFACRRWLEPGASALEQSRAADRFDEFASRPLTRAVIDDLLAAALG